jgi:16S rRNA (uracil1498-N3)-methyltransferase
MHRFFIEKQDIEGNFARLNEEDAAHVSRVLRLQEGDEIQVCDGEEGEYRARIRSIGKQRAAIELLERLKCQTEPRVKVTLYQGVPKAGKLEVIVRQCTEIGASCFVPFFCERCVVRPGRQDKTERFQRVAYEAAKQSRRGIVPRVCAPLVSLEELCARLKEHELVLAAWEEESCHTVRQALEGSGAQDVAIVIGPEGGLTEEEIAAMKEAGARAVTLGPRILRTETAGSVVCALALYELGQMQR